MAASGGRVGFRLVRMPEAAAPAADGGDTMSVRSEEEPARPPPEAPAPTATVPRHAGAGLRQRQDWEDRPSYVRLLNL